MPGISVVIPAHNRSRLLGRALDSVLAQTLPALEIILVDDGSTDGTGRLVQECYSGVTLLRQDNLGVSAARNAGIRCARGDWIALLDSDDEWLPDKLARLMEAQSRRPEYLVIHSNEIWIRDGRRIRQQRKHRKYGGRIFRKCLPLCAISPSAAVIHRTVFERVGLFDTSLPACEDYDLWLRICSRYPVLFLDRELIIKHGGHDDQLSRRYRAMDRFRIRAINKILTQDCLEPGDRIAAVSMLREKLRICLNGARKHGNTELMDEFRQLAARHGLV